MELIEANYDIPLFESEFPEEASFMQKVFSTGGTFKRIPGDDGNLSPIREIPRNAPCPCGSGKKVKKCHVEWTDKSPGLSDEAILKIQKVREERELKRQELNKKFNLAPGSLSFDYRFKNRNSFLPMLTVLGMAASSLTNLK